MCYFFIGLCLHGLWVDEVSFFNLHPSNASSSSIGCEGARHFWKVFSSTLKVVHLPLAKNRYLSGSKCEEWYKHFCIQKSVWILNGYYDRISKWDHNMP